MTEGLAGMDELAGMLPFPIMGNGRRLMLRQERAREAGASLLETAIVVPILLVILAGVVDVGRAYHTYITMLNAAKGLASVPIIHGIPAESARRWLTKPPPAVWISPQPPAR